MMLAFINHRLLVFSTRYGYKIQKYHKLSYVHHPGTEPLRSLTIGKLLEQTAKSHGDRKAIISRAQNQTLTFHEVLDQADRLAAGLNSIGICIGDRVGIWAPNLIEWYVSFMACARAGYILVNINPAYQRLEMQYCINKVGVKTLICAHQYKTQNYYDILNTISPELFHSEPGKLNCKNIPTLKNIIISSDETLKGTFSYKEIFDFATISGIENIRKMQDSIDPDDICHVQFTSPCYTVIKNILNRTTTCKYLLDRLSCTCNQHNYLAIALQHLKGTTGEPKAPVQTHFQLVNNAIFSGKRNEMDKKHHTICVQVPFFHVFGTNPTITSALNYGNTLVLPAPSFNPEKSLEALRDEKCTFINGTPTMYVDLINQQKNRNEDIYLEIAVSGGATCSPHLLRAMKEILKVKKVKSVFGLTESTAVVFHSLYDDDEYHSTATVGYVQDHLEAKVVTEQGTMVPRGTPGELCIRGYSNTLGYWEDDVKTKELIGKDNWLRTGDQFIIEESGYGRIVGRIKEMINRGGENIFPREIEDLLNTHPHILETQVIGIPHERLGEEVCACIRLQENTSVTLEEIKTYCKEKIAYFKIPSALKIVESFPKTTSGKIQKFKIMESIKANK